MCRFILIFYCNNKTVTIADAINKFKKKKNSNLFRCRRRFITLKWCDKDIGAMLSHTIIAISNGMRSVFTITHKGKTSNTEHCLFVKTPAEISRRGLTNEYPPRGSVELNVLIYNIMIDLESFRGWTTTERVPVSRYTCAELWRCATTGRLRHVHGIVSFIKRRVDFTRRSGHCQHLLLDNVQWLHYRVYDFISSHSRMRPCACVLVSAASLIIGIWSRPYIHATVHAWCTFTDACRHIYVCI